MGETTAGLPLRAGEHHERCVGCGTVFRTKRRTRFRCPKIGCKALMHALAAPDGAGYHRRAVEGDPRTFRVYLRRPAEGETADPGDDGAAIFLEAPGEPAPAPASRGAARDPGPDPDPVSYTHLTLPTNREV